jgi:hypothetical protein
MFKYSGSTLPGFSGAPYMLGARIAGVHLGAMGPGAPNVGVDATFLRSLIEAAAMMKTFGEYSPEAAFDTQKRANAFEDGADKHVFNLFGADIMETSSGFVARHGREIQRLLDEAHEEERGLEGGFEDELNARVSRTISRFREKGWDTSENEINKLRKNTRRALLSEWGLKDKDEYQGESLDQPDVPIPPPTQYSVPITICPPPPKLDIQALGSYVDNPDTSEEPLITLIDPIIPLREKIVMSPPPSFPTGPIDLSVPPPAVSMAAASSAPVVSNQGNLMTPRKAGASPAASAADSCSPLRDTSSRCAEGSKPPPSTGGLSKSSRQRNKHRRALLDFLQREGMLSASHCTRISSLLDTGHALAPHLSSTARSSNERSVRLRSN